MKKILSLSFILLLLFLFNSALSLETGKPKGLIIRNGLIVTVEGKSIGDIRVRDGKISEIGKNLLKAVHGEEEINAQGLLVLPGGIDPHVHLVTSDSSDGWVDDFTSGSKAALAGGITTLGNMSFPLPEESLTQMLMREMKLVAKQTITDIILHPVIVDPTEENLLEISQLGQEGFSSIKVFMILDNFERDILGYLKAMRLAKEAGMLTMIHCEDLSIITTETEALVAEGKTSLHYYAESRPVISEVVATQRAVAMCEATDAPVYIVHLSSGRALNTCEEAQSRGLSVYVETRPLYLHFTSDRYKQPDGALYVGFPPLRFEGDVKAMWDGLSRGTIHVLASDHAPYTKKMKLDPSLDITKPRPGVSNLQVMFPMLYSEGVRGGKITLEKFVALSSTNAAKLFGLFPRKGTIAVGSDADLVLWDPDETRTIRVQDMFSRSDFSIYEGIEVTGWPKVTILRGEVVYQKGRILGKPGFGEILLREKYQPLSLGEKR